MMLVRLCICALVPRLETSTRLVLVIHHREIRKPTNTGALAARCLANSEVHVTGVLGRPTDYARLGASVGTNLYLFPSPDAPVLTPALRDALPRPFRLIVPDGNWGQAGRVRRKLASGPAITDVALMEGPRSTYRLRREAAGREDGLATLEAIARAYAVLEGEAVSAALLQLFNTMVERTLWSRGKLRADEVTGGIPSNSSFRDLSPSRITE
jgi:DTW domain-containing protein YfiP